MSTGRTLLPGWEPHEKGGAMPLLRAEDVQSCIVVLGVLEAEIGKLAPASRVRSAWEDLSDYLRGRPTAAVWPMPQLPASDE